MGLLCTEHFSYPNDRPRSERPDTIRSIVAGLVGESNDLVDENEPIQPIQNQYEDYTDRNWQPEAIDASPGMTSLS